MTEPPVEPDVVGWVDVDTVLEEEWTSSLTEDELRENLEVAYEQCIDFGPLLANGRRWTTAHTGPTPARFAKAQKLQARALARSTYTGSNNETGLDGMTVTVFPMDWTVKNLLRPRRAMRYPR
ncbi:hypothetical protein CBR64_00105 [Cellulosimicrobium cellulans]|uniref:Head-to-tail adaptor n=1 Tax=Cellulosimicrobium cellulans TaxID=1710 RepID=A0A1Y0HS66_CELCE|nr:hypothetical protein [Cellulosimicrobium cellulans]ARU50154.1 hypothetical protein CBR64_00105 [Cellulosimicrobium cellulans]